MLLLKQDLQQSNFLQKYLLEEVKTEFEAKKTGTRKKVTNNSVN